MTTSTQPSQLNLLQALHDALSAILKLDEADPVEVPRLAAEIVDRYAGLHSQERI